MALHFSANQFNKAYSAKRLGNWELPKEYLDRPRNRRGSTKVIANDNGHLLPNIKRDQNPWGNYRGTYQLPDRLTRSFAEKYNDCLTNNRWKKSDLKARICEDTNNNTLGVTGTSFDCSTKCETAKTRLLSGDRAVGRVPSCEKKKVGSPKSPRKPFNFDYTPGDFTPPEQQHSTRQLLLDQKFERDNNLESELPLNKLYLSDHDCSLQKCDNKDLTYAPPVGLTAALTTPLVSPPIVTADNFDTNYNLDIDPPILKDIKMPHNSITEKPNERCPSPIVPAYANFEMAKRMHHDNLDHQPLPDSVADLAYRKSQLLGGQPGMALDIDPIATGVGVRMHNAGPTHCTKMKVYRPKTCGVVPKAYEGDSYRPFNSANNNKKMGAMDLAICWDYRPANPADEPRRPVHIDGSNDSTGPAVFTYVRTPRDDGPPETGRSAGVFTSTLGEKDFFDKDIQRRKADFGGRNTVADPNCGCNGIDATMPRARSVSRNYCDEIANTMPNRNGKQYRSSPNIMSDDAYKAIRQKYLGNDHANHVNAPGGPSCKRANVSLLRRARNRLCHRVAPEPESFCHGPPIVHRPCRAAFRVGVPKYDAAGHFISTDSGCSMGSNHATRVLVVPRPRNPYSKKNYDIDTLVPPFRCGGGGAGEGGYPEHWRLASVYQHAYKPPAQRRRPLLETVYK